MTKRYDDDASLARKLTRAIAKANKAATAVARDEMSRDVALKLVDACERLSNRITFGSAEEQALAHSGIQAARKAVLDAEEPGRAIRRLRREVQIERLSEAPKKSMKYVPELGDYFYK